MLAAKTAFRAKGSPLKRLLKSWRLYALLAPALIYLFMFHYLPLYGVQIAFRDYVPSLGFLDSAWVGLKHFQYFVTSPQFPTLMGNTVLLSLFYLLFKFPLPILLALMLNEARCGWYKKVVQNLTYAPHFISIVVLVGMMVNFLSPSTGIINNVITFFGGTPTDFMGKADMFRPIYIISGLWQSTGWESIIYLAALSGVDPQLHEAAQIDGASHLKRIWHISIPGILPTAIMLFILNCGQIMDVGFEKVYLMQNAMNLSASEIISTYVYKVGVIGNQFSYTSAIGLFNSLINVTLLLIVNGVSRKLSDTSLF